MNYKYYLKVTDQNGRVIFYHRSNNPLWLEKLYKKAAYDYDNMFCDYYFGTEECNYDRKRAQFLIRCREPWESNIYYEEA